MATPLHQQRCLACEGGIPPLDQVSRDRLLPELSSDWSLNADGTALHARYQFRNYYETTAFVNAVAWIAHQENHHPDISLSYRECTVLWTTHAAQGLTHNDFICAAKVDALHPRPHPQGTAP